MKVIVFDNAQSAAQYAYNQFEQALKDGATTFGLATGSTPEPLYQLLRESDLDFTQATSINLDEYYGLSADHPQSYAYYMNEQLFHAKPFAHHYLPDGTNTDPLQETARYDQLIEDNPIDLQILGIGQNAHIGFNEPGTSFNSKTSLVDLTESTIQANQRFFEQMEDVPKQAYSMGIQSIMGAKKIILLAFGENKAQAIYDTVEGPVSEAVPASILQNHPDCYILLDEAAASQLNPEHYERVH